PGNASLWRAGSRGFADHFAEVMPRAADDGSDRRLPNRLRAFVKKAAEKGMRAVNICTLTPIIFHLMKATDGLDAERRRVYGEDMNRLSGFVTLNPYFRVPPNKLDSLKAILPEFAAKTRDETGNLFYEFSINGDEVFCREGYVNAEALLAHLENVSGMLEAARNLAELVRIEVHGPAEELAKLKAPLADLNPAWFTLHGLSWGDPF